MALTPKGYASRRSKKKSEQGDLGRRPLGEGDTKRKNKNYRKRQRTSFSKKVLRKAINRNTGTGEPKAVLYRLGG